MPRKKKAMQSMPRPKRGYSTEWLSKSSWVSAASPVRKQARGGPLQLKVSPVNSLMQNAYATHGV